MERRKPKLKTKEPASVIGQAFGTKRRLLIAAAVVAAVAGSALFLSFAGPAGYGPYNRQAEMEPIRTLIVRSIESFGTPAPVDAKTGDTYFPQAALFLPASVGQDMLSPVSYTYTWEEAARSLTVVDRAILRHKTTTLYTAQNIDELFERVPAVQACSRGVMVQPAGKTPQGWKRHGSLKAADGSVLYLYADTLCPDNQAVAERLRLLRAY